MKADIVNIWNIDISSWEAILPALLQNPVKNYCFFYLHFTVLTTTIHTSLKVIILVNPLQLLIAKNIKYILTAHFICILRRKQI